MAVTALTGRRSRVRITLVAGAGVHILGCGAPLSSAPAARCGCSLCSPESSASLRGLIGPHDLAGLLLGVAAAFFLVCAADRSPGRVGTGPRRRP